MSKIVIKGDTFMVDNNGRAVVYDYAEDVVVLPANVRITTDEGLPMFEECDAIIANGSEFLASCTALYGCFSVKYMEE